MKAAIELASDNRAYVQIIHDGARLAFIETTHGEAKGIYDAVKSEILSAEIPVGTPNAVTERVEIAKRIAAKFRK